MKSIVFFLFSKNSAIGVVVPPGGISDSALDDMARELSVSDFGGAKWTIVPTYRLTRTVKYIESVELSAYEEE